MNNYGHCKDKRFENSLLVKGLALSNKLDFIIKASRISKSTSEVDMIMLEGDWTDMVKRLVDLGNEFLLPSFNLSLALED
jgi:hypothetical protein